MTFARRVAVVVLLALLPFAAASGTPALSGAPVIIGAVNSSSGPFSPLGEPLLNAYTLAVEDVNARGGIKGRPLRVDVVDDEGRPDIAAQLTTAFVGQKLPIVIGSATTPATFGMARITATSPIVHLYISSTADVWDSTRGLQRHIFEISPRNELQIQKLLPFAKKTLHASRLAIIYDENDYGTNGFKVASAGAPGAGMTVVDAESYATDTTDATAQLLKIKAANPDVILLWGASPSTSLIVRQARALGYAGPIMGGGGILTDNFLRSAGKAGDGLYSVSLLNFTHPSPNERAFMDRYHARFHERPPFVAASGWNAVHLAALALADVPDGDTDKLVAWFEHMRPYLGGTMPMQFTSTNHDGGTSLTVCYAKNGVWFTL